ncbi:MAG: T9SS type A sorting domain-containing protein [Reichenbachiella sp.]
MKLKNLLIAAIIFYTELSFGQFVPKTDLPISASYYDELVDMGVDGSDNVYLLGKKTNSDIDMVLVKCTTSSCSLIATYDSNPSYSVDDIPYKLEVDDSGNCYVIGSYEDDNGGSPNGKTEAIVLKYSSSGGSPLWTYKLDGNSSTSVSYSSSFYDAELVGSTLYAVGFTYGGAAGVQNMLIGRFTSGGTETIRSYDNGSIAEKGHKLVVDGGTIYMGALDNGSLEYYSISTSFTTSTNPTLINSYSTSWSSIDGMAKNGSNVAFMTDLGSSTQIVMYNGSSFKSNTATDIDDPEKIIIDNSNAIVSGRSWYSPSYNLVIGGYAISTGLESFHSRLIVNSNTASNDHQANSSKAVGLFIDGNGDYVVPGNLVLDTNPDDGNPALGLYAGFVVFDNTGSQTGFSVYESAVTVDQGIENTSTGEVVIAGSDLWVLCDPPVVNLSNVSEDFDPIGNSLTIDAGAGFSSYDWSTGASSQSISVSEGGVYSVTVENAAGCSGSSSMEYTIDPIDQTINWSLPFSPFEKTLITDADDFNVSATSSSGLDVDFRSDNLSIARVSDNEDGTWAVSILGAGTVNIIAEQDGDDNYNAAHDVSYSLTVFKTTQTVDFPSFDDLELDEILTLEKSDFTSDSGEDPDDLISSSPSIASVVENASNFEITGNTLGTVTLTIHFPETDTYLEAEATASLEVTKKSQIISITNTPDFSPSYGDSDILVEAESTSSLTLSPSSSDENVFTITDNGGGSYTLHIENAGTANLLFDQIGNATYAAATQYSQVIEVNKASQTITFPPIDDQNFTTGSYLLDATSDSGLEITYSFNSGSGNSHIENFNEVHFDGYGNVSIRANQYGNDNYEAADEVLQSFLILDDVPPVFISETPWIRELSINGFELVIYSDENPSYVYTVILEDGAAAPTSNQVQSLTDANDDAPIASSSFTYPGEFKKTFSTLLEATNYDVYVALEDAHGNLMSDPVLVEVTTLDQTAPNFDNSTPDFISASETTTTIEVSLDEIGTVYYGLVAGGDPALNITGLLNGTINSGSQTSFGFGTIEANDPSENYQIEFSSLVPGEIFDFYAIAEDASTNRSTIETISFTTPDNTAPLFTESYPSVYSINESSFFFDMSLNEPGKIYYVVLNHDVVEPSVAQLKSGTDGEDQAPIKSGSLDFTETEVTANVTSLTLGTDYDLYFVAEDDQSTPNVQTSVTKIQTRTLDLTAPTFLVNSPSISDVDETTFNLSIDLSEHGTVYFVVLEDNSSTPSSEQVKNGTNGDDEIAIVASSESFIGNSLNVFVSGLNHSTPYDIYIVAEDDETSANLQETPEKLEVITAIPIPQGTTYYWIGGSGVWSDLNHWATSSGGDITFGVLPTKHDDIIFDQNSFSAADQVVEVNQDAFCEDMDWSAVTLEVDFKENESTLEVFGSLTVPDNVGLNFMDFTFLSNESETISLGTDPEARKNQYAHYSFEGDGDWSVIDQLTTAGTVTITKNATLDLNGNDLYASSITFGSGGNQTLITGDNSTVTFHWWNNSGQLLDLQYGNNVSFVVADFNTTSLMFRGGDLSYPPTTVEVPIGTLPILGNNSFEKLILSPGVNVNFGCGFTQTIGELEIQGTKSNFITIGSSCSETQATISQSSGIVDGSYINLSDVVATGGATFNAANSVDGGNNSGWNISAPVSQDYFWVGDGGDWDDLSHWATTSGGSTMHTDLPGLIDNVYFDEQSISTENQIIRITSEDVELNDLTLLGIANSPEFFANKTLNIHGSAALGNNVYFNNINNMVMHSVNGTLTGNGASGLRNLIVEKSVTLSDDIYIENLYIKNGAIFNCDNVELKIDDLDVAEGGIVSAQNSTLHIRDTHINSVGEDIDFTGSRVLLYTVEPIFYTYTDLSVNLDFGLSDGNIAFNELSISDNINIKGEFITDLFEINPGTEIQFLDFEGINTINFSVLSAQGTSEDHISISSETPGDPHYFVSLTATEINAEWLEIKDNNASGATFNANNSFDLGGNSGWNVTAPVVPDTPSNLMANSMTSSSFTANWDNILNADNYRITVDDDEDFSSPFIDDISTENAFYEISLLEHGKYYYWRVRAESSGGLSAFSEEIETVTLYNAPVAIEATSVLKDQFTASWESWNSVDGVYDAILQVSANNDFTDLIEGYETLEVVGLSKEVTGLQQETVYYYRVAAVNESGPSEYSNVITVSTSGKLAQSITFGELPSKVYGDDDFNLSASASSGLPVQFTIENESVATLSNGVITIQGAGFTNITASQIGDDDYLPASEVIQVLTIAKAEQMISIAEISDKLTTDPAFDIEAEIDTNLALSYSISGPAMLEGTTITLDGNSGVVTITVSQVGNENYNEAEEEVSFNVDDPQKLDQTISFESLESRTYGDDAFGLTANATSGLEVTFISSDETVATISGNVVTIVGAGQTTITARQDGNDDFNAATDVLQNLIIEKADQTISFSVLDDKSLNDEDFVLDGESNSGLEITFTSSDENIVSIVGSTASIVSEGEVTITASQSGNENYNAALEVSHTFEVIDDVVEKQDQTITFASLAVVTFGDAAFDLIGSASSGLSLNFESSNLDVAIIAGNTITIVGAGSTTITASQSGDETFNSAPDVGQILVVNKADQTISFASIGDKTLDDSEFELVASSDSNLDITFTSSNDNVVTILGATVSIVGPGSVTIIASQAGDANHNAAEDVEQSFDIVDNLVSSTQRGASNAVDVYPNPFTNKINLSSSPEAGNLEWQIISQDGSIVMRGKEQSLDSRINTTTLKRGVYYLRFNNEEGGITTKRIVKK